MAATPALCGAASFTATVRHLPSIERVRKELSYPGLDML